MSAAGETRLCIVIATSAGQRIGGIEALQRQAFALDPDARGLPPEVILGVKVVRRAQAKRVERRERAA